MLNVSSSLPHGEKMKWQIEKIESSISCSGNAGMKWLWYIHSTTISWFNHIIDSVSDEEEYSEIEKCPKIYPLKW